MKEIQGCEDLLKVKLLVLGGVKKTISVVVAHNHEVIVVERRRKITFEDFQNVHAMIATQLVVVDEALQTTL